MKYTIEYEEIIKKINSVTIEVKDKNKGNEIADMLYEKQKQFYHPDDIFYAISNMGIKIVEINEGAENCEYEIQ